MIQTFRGRDYKPEKVFRYVREKNVLEKPYRINPLTAGTTEHDFSILYRLNGKCKEYNSRKLYHLQISLPPEESRRLMEQGDGPKFMVNLGKEFIQNTLEKETFNYKGKTYNYCPTGEACVHFTAGEDAKKGARACLHLHVVLCAVDRNQPHKKLHFSKEMEFRFKEQTNILAKKYGLRTVEFKRGLAEEKTKQWHSSKTTSGKSNSLRWTTRFANELETVLISSNSFYEYIKNLKDRNIDIFSVKKNGAPMTDFTYAKSFEDGTKKTSRGKIIDKRFSLGAIKEYFRFKGDSSSDSEYYIKRETKKDTPLFYDARTDSRARILLAAYTATSAIKFRNELRANGIELTERNVKGHRNNKEYKCSFTGLDGSRHSFLCRTIDPKFTYEWMNSPTETTFATKPRIFKDEEEIRRFIFRVRSSELGVRESYLKLQEAGIFAVPTNLSDGRIQLRYSQRTGAKSYLSTLGEPITKHDYNALLNGQSKRSSKTKEVENLTTLNHTPHSSKALPKKTAIEPVTPSPQILPGKKIKLTEGPCDDCPNKETRGEVCLTCEKNKANTKSRKTRGSELEI